MGVKFPGNSVMYAALEWPLMCVFGNIELTCLVNIEGSKVIGGSVSCATDQA